MEKQEKEDLDGRLGGFMEEKGLVGGVGSELEEEKLDGRMGGYLEEKGMDRGLVGCWRKTELVCDELDGNQCWSFFHPSPGWPAGPEDLQLAGALAGEEHSQLAGWLHRVPGQPGALQLALRWIMDSSGDLALAAALVEIWGILAE